MYVQLIPNLLAASCMAGAFCLHNVTNTYHTHDGINAKEHEWAAQPASYANNIMHVCIS